MQADIQVFSRGLGGFYGLVQVIHYAVDKCGYIGIHGAFGHKSTPPAKTVWLTCLQRGFFREVLTGTVHPKPCPLC